MTPPIIKCMDCGLFRPARLVAIVDGHAIALCAPCRDLRVAQFTAQLEAGDPKAQAIYQMVTKAAAAAARKTDD